jgi:hypothetical protein
VAQTNFLRERRCSPCELECELDTYGSTHIGWLQPGSVIQTQGVCPTTQVSPSWLPLCGNSSVLASLPLSRLSTSTPYGIVKSREVPRDHINRGLPEGGNRTSWARGTLGSLCGRNTGRAGLTLEGVLAGVGGKRAGVGWLAGASWPVAGAARGCLLQTYGEGC